MLFDARSLLADARRRSLDAALRPRVDAFAQGYYGNPGMNMFDDMMRYRLSLNGLIGIRLNWNIGALYTRRADLASLDNEREQIRTERETFLFNNRQDVVRLRKEVERLEKLRPGDAELVRLRTSIRRAAEAKLRGGVIDADALLEKITDEHRAQVEASVHDIELLKTLYALQTLTQSPL
ncbi:outer membrane efflux protein [Prevotella sp. CAG:755]|nr:outer membrane efflux protein [Prevotella sp. CAG:755]